MEQNKFKEISINQLKGVRFGQSQSMRGMTGVSVAIFEGPNTGGIDISGGGPASRETPLLMAETDSKSINALVFSGGSAFGLAAADGVSSYLEEKQIGYQIDAVTIPLVVQSCIYDLNIGDPKIRPDFQMGYQACQAAEVNANPQSGIVGAGTGATVGNFLGMQQSQKSGIGFFAIQLGDLQIGAMVVVNAWGDIFNYQNGTKIAGLLTSDRQTFLSTEQQLYNMANTLQKGANTTLAAIFTNAQFSEADMNKIARMARSGLSRSINPVNTMADGDTVYAFSLGDQKADLNLVGTLSATVLSEAILRAVNSSHLADAEFLDLVVNV